MTEPSRIDSAAPLTIAAIVPCHNEATSIGAVVSGLQAAVPEIVVYVYDNNSTDNTAEVALAAGAQVRYEHRKGKGNVIRRAFADIEADVYVVIDGDDTYDTAALPSMLEALLAGPLDHVVGVRQQSTPDAFRRGHVAGNRFFNEVVSKIFDTTVTDMLSGYRVFSRRFVKSFPAVATEFETEAELTIHAATLRVPQSEQTVAFRERDDGSESKLRTFSDGFRILRLILHLARVERPVLFHGIIAALISLVGLVLALPILDEYARTGLVPRFPTVFGIGIIEVIASMTFFLGLSLSAIKRSKDEAMRLRYLAMAPPQGRLTDGVS